MKKFIVALVVTIVVFGALTDYSIETAGATGVQKPPLLMAGTTGVQKPPLLVAGTSGVQKPPRLLA